MGSEEKYGWLALLAVMWEKNLEGEESPRHPMATINSVGGRLAHAEKTAANDHPEAHLILCLFLLGICAKYRAFLSIFTQTRAKYHQNLVPDFFSLKSPETRTIQSLHETSAKFLTLLTLCQMNSAPSCRE